ncbi:MAG: neutral zinc metallopeptidase [Asticcacaulis sp.]|nr:neutral zinc metallopeptidase [Asticcacaulis sp.]
MRWEGGRSSGVEDRRGGGMGGPGLIGGGGLAAVVIALIGYFVFHIDPRETLAGLQGTGDGKQAEASVGSPQDEEGHFADVIHTSVNDTWEEIFRAKGKSYHPSTIVLYDNATPTGCGGGQAAMGPFYCPQDERVYLDLSFNRTLEQQLGAGGDFARAYVIAHEVGHHVQNLLGISAAVEKAEQRLGGAGANRMSVKLELQADCYAGVWAYRSDQKQHWLEAGDIEEAINAASAVGDDTLQQASQGRVVPDSFTHGSSADRVKWFKAGFAAGDPADCDTFGGSL